ncbi:2OG-Fe(II) oxygenase [Aquiflexum lacus]|uniref:2OG-Fe(II) oxygenase n=1 Tax=Aquiflexum lacus TaxID=2483805 RepID=UPI0018959E88|nr:2OG-Fe(II) oxygenase [Aquiflexum lacus]
MNQPDILQLPWEKIYATLLEIGFMHLPNLIDRKTCDLLINLYKEDIYRKKVIMEHHRFGLGEYKYFSYPLPSFIEKLRSDFYLKLSPIANQWMKMLQLQVSFPSSHIDFIESCKANQQLKPTPLILKYGVGGYNTLHQDLYGSVYFPIQVVLFLNDYGHDYQGGEFVITEQIPRFQSKVKVFQPGIGDALIFATSFRPIKGRQGYYKANLRHGVSEVTGGNRHTLGIIFHDAVS